MAKRKKVPQEIPPISDPPMTYQEFYEYWTKKYPKDKGFLLDFEYALYLDPINDFRMQKVLKELNEAAKNCIGKVKTIKVKL